MVLTSGVSSGHWTDAPNVAGLGVHHDDQEGPRIEELRGSEREPAMPSREAGSKVRGGRNRGRSAAHRATELPLESASPPVSSARVRPSWLNDSSDRPNGAIKSALVIRTIMEPEADLDEPGLDEPDEELGRPVGIVIAGFVVSARVLAVTTLGVGLLAAIVVSTIALVLSR